MNGNTVLQGGGGGMSSLKDGGMQTSLVGLYCFPLTNSHHLIVVLAHPPCRFQCQLIGQGEWAEEGSVQAH